MASNIDELKAKLAELDLTPDQLAWANDALDYLTGLGQQLIKDWFALMRAKQLAKAHKMLLKAMSPSQIVAEQAAAHPFIVSIAVANYQDKEARDALMERLWGLIENIVIMSLFD